jgi:hypothetical protein
MMRWLILPGMGATAAMYDGLKHKLGFQVNFLTRRAWIFILPMMLPVFAPGCTATFKYNPSDPVDVAIKPLPLKVVVTPLQDNRGNKNSDLPLCSYGMPLLAYGKVHDDRPEGGGPGAGRPHHVGNLTFEFNPAADIAAAVAVELAQNHFFDTVVFGSRNTVSDADLVLGGRITKTDYDATIYCYLLGPLAGVPYLLALPMASVTNVLEVEFVMYRASDNAVVWSHEVKEKWGMTLGFYYNTYADLDGFPIMLREGLHRGMETLADAVRTKDLNYWKAEVMVQPK